MDLKSRPSRTAISRNARISAPIATRGTLADPTLRFDEMTSNRLIDSDTQHQKAVSQQLPCARHRQRQIAILYVVTAIAFLVLPAGLAMFLLWRAYQLGVKDRVELTHQWISRPPAGIETFAIVFAWRDVIFGVGLLVCLALLLVLPRYFLAWIPLMAAFSFVHQGFTGYALYKLRKK